MYRLAIREPGPSAHTRRKGHMRLSDNYTWLDTVELGHTESSPTAASGGNLTGSPLRRSLPIADNGEVIFLPGVTGYATDFQSFLADAPLVEGGRERLGQP